MFNRIFLVFALCLGTGLSAAEVAATLIKAVGSGQVFLAGGGSADFKAGTLLRAGSRIVTREGALAQLMMDDGSRVSIGPNTDLTLSESRKEGEVRSTVFDLVKGLFKATVQKLTLGSRFDVKTPDAVAAVKGTQYQVQVDENGTEASVLEGRVWLDDAAGERRVVGAHQAVRALRQGRLEELRELSPDELRHFGDWAHESLAPHSGALLPVDQAKREAWARLRPAERRKVLGDLAASLGDTWSDITGLTAEERQERWRDRLRNADERRLAAEGARVDFALGKTALDRQGRRVRFDEFLLRPAADQIQFVNYTRRDDRTDVLSSINRYNRALPQALSDAPGLNQRIWAQGLLNPPQYWVVSNALVAGNNGGDSYAASTNFYDPYFRGLYWELPIKDLQVRLNIPDLQQPRLGGVVVESWVRQGTVVGGAITGVIAPSLGLGAIGGTASSTQPLRAVPGTANNLLDIDHTNLVWALGDSTTMPTTSLVGLAGLEAQPGDLAFGITRHYSVSGDDSGGPMLVSAHSSPINLQFRTYVINENGQIVNLAGLSPDQLMQAFVDRSLIASLNQIEIRSSLFSSEDGIDVVSKLLFLHDLTKTQDQL